jgi:hypothetical protein
MAKERAFKYVYVLVSHLKYWMDDTEIKPGRLVELMRLRYHDNVSVGVISRYRMVRPTPKGSSRPNLQRAIQIVNILKEVALDLRFEDVWEVEKVKIEVKRAPTIAQKIKEWDEENPYDL